MKLLRNGITCPFRKVEIAYDFEITSALSDESTALQIYDGQVYSERNKTLLTSDGHIRACEETICQRRHLETFWNTWANTDYILRMRKLYRIRQNCNLI